MTNTNNPIHKIFYPESIAVVGASSSPESLSWKLLDNIISYGYKGRLYPVNPKYPSVHSIKSYKSIRDIPDVIDHAILMLPRDLVLNAIDDCHKKKIVALTVITAGFKETGNEGAELEKKLVEKIKGYGIRLVGPNCMGVINTSPDVMLNGTFVQGTPEKGGIGFVSQSGALGAAVLKTLQQNDTGLAQFISIGNKADISGNAVIEYWAENPDIRVITVYLESFSNPRRFMELTREVTRSKPVIVIKSARTAAGMKAASSHTGALAGSDTVVDAFLEQSGVLRVNNIDEMFDLAKSFDRAKIPAGNRVGILTNAGGPAILAVDECEKTGLTVPELSKKTQNRLRQIAPKEASVSNPVDLLPPASGETYSKAIKAMLQDKNIDSLIVVLGPPLMTSTINIAKSICGAIKQSSKTAAVVLMSQDDVIPMLRKESDQHPPLFRFPENAVRVIEKMLQYKKWKVSHPGSYVRFDVKKAGVSKILSRYTNKRDTYLAFDDVKAILEAYGLPLIESINAYSTAETIEAARRVHYPVVLKAMGKDLIHKSDIGAVVTNIHNKSELLKATGRIFDNLKQHRSLRLFENFLVQHYAGDGVETIMGVSKDISAGHLIMFGLGGIFVEVFKDVKFRMLPINDKEASDMIKGIKSYKLLTGVRGKKPVNISYIEENLLRLSQLVEDFPVFTEIDLNPFIFNPENENCRILDARMKV